MNNNINCKDYTDCEQCYRFYKNVFIMGYNHKINMIKSGDYYEYVPKFINYNNCNDYDIDQKDLEKMIEEQEID